MISTPDNDNTRDEPMVFIIIAKAYEAEGDEGIDLHILLSAPDDDTAVRLALNALSDALVTELAAALLVLEQPVALDQIGQGDEEQGVVAGAQQHTRQIGELAHGGIRGPKVGRGWCTLGAPT